MSRNQLVAAPACKDERLDEHCIDPNPGVFSFQLEKAPAIDGWQVTEEVAHSMPGDVQLKCDSERLEDDVFRRNAQKACANCPGHCCLAFFLGFAKSKIPAMLAARRREAVEHIANIERHDQIMFFHTGKHSELSVEAGLRAEQLLTEIETLEFFQHRLIPRRFTGQRRSRMHLYGCKAFDPVARRCTQYENRPKLCRQYVCGPATAGFPPRPDTMQTKHVPALAPLINAHISSSLDSRRGSAS